MSRDPWTDPNPQPGDFDEFLESIDPEDPRYVERQEPNADAEVTILPPGFTENYLNRLLAEAATNGASASELLDAIPGAWKHTRDGWTRTNTVPSS